MSNSQKRMAKPKYTIIEPPDSFLMHVFKNYLESSRIKNLKLDEISPSDVIGKDPIFSEIMTNQYNKMTKFTRLKSDVKKEIEGDPLLCMKSVSNCSIDVNYYPDFLDEKSLERKFKEKVPLGYSAGTVLALISYLYLSEGKVKTEISACPWGFGNPYEKSIEGLGRKIKPASRIVSSGDDLVIMPFGAMAICEVSYEMPDIENGEYKTPSIEKQEEMLEYISSKEILDFGKEIGIDEKKCHINDKGDLLSSPEKYYGQDQHEFAYSMKELAKFYFGKVESNRNPFEKYFLKFPRLISELYNGNINYNKEISSGLIKIGGSAATLGTILYSLTGDPQFLIGGLSAFASSFGASFASILCTGKYKMSPGKFI